MADKQQYERILTKDEYRKFIQYIEDNYAEIYGNKISYSVRKIKEKFIVSLDENTVIDFNDIFA
jgi:hypothetical protein